MTILNGGKYAIMIKYGGYVIPGYGSDTVYFAKIWSLRLLITIRYDPGLVSQIEFKDTSA